MKGKKKASYLYYYKFFFFGSHHQRHEQKIAYRSCCRSTVQRLDRKRDQESPSAAAENRQHVHTQTHKQIFKIFERRTLRHREKERRRQVKHELSTSKIFLLFVNEDVQQSH